MEQPEQQPKVRPSVRPGGLVTVAFLKAKLDENADRLSIFMPLVQDVVAAVPDETFTTDDVQQDLAEAHKINIPYPALQTLLRRCVSAGYLKREFGRYKKLPKAEDLTNVTNAKSGIAASLNDFARRFVSFAAEHNFACNEQEALNLIYCFLEDQQIAVLLEQEPETTSDCKLSHRETVLVAQFLSEVARPDPALSNVLRGLLEGLVLYHAAFLPDFEASGRNFNDLIVYFDSDLVRRALGYEGQRRQMVMREIIALFHAVGIRCYVFDKTVAELQHILEHYEEQCARGSSWRRFRVKTEMDRFFLRRRFSRGDISEMIGLLNQNISKERLRIVSTPARIPKYVSNEAALEKRLANPLTQDVSEPRIAHDVDCIAAILTMRKGNTPTRVEDSRFIFASSSFTVIRDISDWYREDDESGGVPPVINIQILSNLAWLKRPRASSDLKEQELMALCAAAMRPSDKLWSRFLRHLAAQHQEQRITSDEEAAILVDHLSQQLLFRAESYARDGDVDAESIEDVIERVKDTYKKDYDQKLAAKEQNLREEAERADMAERAARDLRRSVLTATTKKAAVCASILSKGVFAILLVSILGGSIYLLIDVPLPGARPAAAAILFVLVVGACFDVQDRFKRIREWCSALERGLCRQFERVFRTLPEELGHEHVD